MFGTLIETRPGDEARVLADAETDERLALGADSVILVGERLVSSPGSLSAALTLAARTGAKLAWVPRRAGDRPALDSGCMPNLLPGGRPVADPSARADLSAAWGTGSLPAEPGRDHEQILAAARNGELDALLVAGVERDDLPDPDAAVEAIEAAPFVVIVEVRASAVSERADVVLPVAAVAEKSGSFINWEGRPRPFGVVIDAPNALSDVRVIAGISEELDTPLGFRTPEQAGVELDEVGLWDGDRVPAPSYRPVEPAKLDHGEAVLQTWRELIDDGRGQDGEEYYKATARRSVARLSSRTLQSIGVTAGDEVVVRTDHGAVALPTEAVGMPDDVVWVAANSHGLGLN